jgi:hypothetical protein
MLDHIFNLYFLIGYIPDFLKISIIKSMFKNMQPYTGCPGRNAKNFSRVFLMLKYTDMTKHLYPKLNGYGDNDHRKVGASVVSTHCKLPADSPNACPSFSKVSYYILNCITSG